MPPDERLEQDALEHAAQEPLKLEGRGHHLACAGPFGLEGVPDDMVEPPDADGLDSRDLPEPKRLDVLDGHGRLERPAEWSPAHFGPATADLVQSAVHILDGLHAHLPLRPEFRVPDVWPERLGRGVDVVAVPDLLRHAKRLGKTPQAKTE